MGMFTKTPQVEKIRKQLTRAQIDLDAKQKTYNKVMQRQWWYGAERVASERENVRNAREHVKVLRERLEIAEINQGE